MERPFTNVLQYYAVCRLPGNSKPGSYVTTFPESTMTSNKHLIQYTHKYRVARAR